MVSWLPMRSAPRGKLIVLLLEWNDAVVASWEVIEGCNEDGTGGVQGWVAQDENRSPFSWDNGMCWDHSIQPVGWMPLTPPEPPESQTL
jgi:hypothetical protein